MLNKILGKFKKTEHSFMLYAFANGKVVKLSSVSDEVFSSGMLGKGVAIEPVEGRIVSPCGGRVEHIFETKHAINIVSDFGCEILIHIGLDTVTLKGKYFDIKVSEGDRVEQGDVLCEFDINGIKSEGLKVTTPMVVSNSDSFSKIDPRPECKISIGDGLLRIVK